MKKGFFKGVLFVFMIFFTCSLKADEGMWLLNLIHKLNQDDMEKLGLKLTAEEIYSVNNSSLKDAIVSFGGGCSAGVISQQGLLLTNHHCGFSAIVQNSTIENDYITNGFWAMSMNEELPAKGLFVKFLVRIEDVTEQVLSNVHFEMSEIERSEAVQNSIENITAAAVKGTEYQAEVKELFYGNEYYLFVYEVYSDIRLVGAPPSAIGNFGGDTDNWMWPRHTGDFALFRIYASPDNKPSEYNKANVPFIPKKWLSISLDSYQENDFAMIIGYPGRTTRNLTSYGVRSSYEIVNPAIIKIREKKLKIMSNDMKGNDRVRLKYADKYASTANYYKYFIGQNKGIQRLDVIDRKKTEEDDFETWVNNPDQLKTDYYENAIPLVMMSYSKLPDKLYVNTYLRESLLRGTDVIPFAIKFRDIYNELQKLEPNISKIEELKGKLLPQAEVFFSGFVKPTERRLFESMIEMYYNDVRPEYHPAPFSDIDKKYNQNFRVYADMVFTTSIFTDSAKCVNFLKKPTLKVIENDPMLLIALSVDDMMKKIQDDIRSLNYQMNKGMRLYLKGMMEMHPERKFYPDANSTMRLTYGQIMGYQAADAVQYDFITYFDGVIAKENPESDEFIVPDKLKELYAAGDFGQYADKNGKLPVCFLANLDVTGGNSGSPVLNGKGELIGITFDANWEAMSMDITYESELQRAINVDIRYVLFIIDKFAGAGHLIDEMTIVKEKN